MPWKEFFKRLGCKRRTQEKNVRGNYPSAYQTQFEGTPSNAPRQQLVIGLDFGTAFTKVVIGEARVKYAVPFEICKNESNPFLLPGVLIVGDDEECFLFGPENDGKTVADLKMRLLLKDYSEESLIHVGAFFALVFRYTRAWVLNELAETYRNYGLDWYVNVGLPTDSFDDEKLSEVYRSIVKTAWAASICKEPITLALVKRMQVFEELLDNSEEQLEPDCRERLIHPEKISLFPEFAAQLTGYVRSPLRQPDLHAIIDVGAGTVDMVVFNVYESEGTDTYAIMAQAVRPHGVHFLLTHRIKGSGYAGDWTLSLQEQAPQVTEFVDRLGVSSNVIKQLDQEFLNKVGGQFGKNFKETKNSRYPKSPKWEEGVPVFLCGGGARFQPYYDLVSRMEQSGKPYKIDMQKMPRPRGLRAPGIGDQEYDRLSVAYGLSFDAFDIGQIIPKHKIDDIQAGVHLQQDRFRENYVDKDMV